MRNLEKLLKQLGTLEVEGVRSKEIIEREFQLMPFRIITVMSNESFCIDYNPEAGKYVMETTRSNQEIDYNWMVQLNAIYAVMLEANIF